MIKQRRLLSGLVCMALIIMALCLVDARFAAAADPLKLTILHMNDPHAHYLPYAEKGAPAPIGGFAKARAVMSHVEQVNEQAGRPTLTFLAGDLLMGTPFSTVFKGSLGVTLLNTMKITAMTVGNHEFDYGQENLIQKLKEQVQFPLLSANIKDETGKPVFQGSIRTPLQGSDKTALIFGLTTIQTPTSTHPSNVKGIWFEDPLVVAAEIIKDAKPDDLVIAVTHIGFEADRKLAEACPRINVIIGGHSHTELHKPVKVNDTLICQAGSYSKYIGRLDLEFADGKVLDYEGRLILLDQNIKQDQEIARIIQDHKRLLDEKFSGIIGTTRVALEGNCRWAPAGQSTNFGRLVGFVMASSSGSGAALFNAGSIRKGIDEGNISSADVYTALPFANSIVKMDLAGADLAAVLQRGADLEEGSGGRLQTFGIQFSLPDGKVKIDKVGDKDFDADGVYSIAVNDFLAAGGDGYTIIKEKGRNPYATSMPLSDILVDFIKQKKVITDELFNNLK